MKKILCSALLALGGMASVSAAFAEPPPPHHPPHHRMVCKRVMEHHHWVRHCR